MVERLAIGGGIAVVAGGVYWMVADAVARRKVAPESQPASVAFALWWYLLAGSSLVTGLQTWMYAADSLSLELALSFAQLNITLVILGLAGLLYYLLFLFTGWKTWWKALVVFYIPYFVLLQYFIHAQHAIGVEDNGWTATIAYQNKITGLLFTVVVILLIVPQIAGAIAYLTLAPKAPDRARRFRIVVVSLSIIIWFSTALLASATELAEKDWWQLVTRFLGLGAAVAILVSFRPPQRLDRWLTADQAEAKPAAG